LPETIKKTLEEEHMDISSTVIAALAERRGSAPEDITNDTTFAELALDSLDVAEMVMELEDTFNITIDLSKIKGTIGDLIAVIEEAQQA
jgi:acyl carrier protein